MRGLFICPSLSVYRNDKEVPHKKLVSLFLLFCAVSFAEDTAFTVTDMKGREMTLAASAQRIAVPTATCPP